MMNHLNRKELLLQLLLHLILFIIFSFDKDHPHVHTYHFAFFANYALAAYCINYFFLPRYYYTKRYLVFFIGVFLLLILVILMEEFVLEKIFFPTTRGKYFTGFLYTLLEVLPNILILTGFKFAWDAHQKHKELTELQQTVKDSELRFLKSQINPHFLFNNLNNLYSYAIEHSPKTPSIILELSAVLRYMLYDCKEDFVPLTKEIEHLQSFTQLNELQIENRGTVTFSKEPFPGNHQIAPLILSVFIENAFKHSMASQGEGILIDIRVKVTSGGVLQFSCTNSYQPIGNTQGLSRGIGLENVKKRLALIYPDRYQLDIQQTADRYTVNLAIALDENLPLN